MEKRLVIAGGGLAGLACGIRLAEAGWQVTVHERRRYPLKKVCGEFLSPEGWRRVQGLGADWFLARLPRPLKRARFYADGRRYFDFDLAPKAWGLSRATLDSALAERFRDVGGELREGSELLGLEPGTLDARGRPPVDGGRWLGWKAYLAAAADPPELEVADLLMLPVAGGYCGLSRIEDGRISACLVARAAIPLPQVLASHPLLKRYAGDLQPHAAIARFDFEAWPGVQRVGDARRVWPPLVGDGMTQALASGEAAARALISGQRSWRPAVPLQFALAKGLHGLMLQAWARRAAAVVCRAVPALPRAVYRLSRG